MSSAASRLGWGVALSVLDIAGCLLCGLLHGSTPSWSNITSQFTSFSIFTSTVDLMLLCAVRVVLWLLPAVFHKVGRVDHLPHMKQVIFCTSLLMYAASPTKLLLITEKLNPGTYLPVGDYAFLVWNFLAAFLLDLSWKTYFIHPPSSYVLVEEQDEDEELPPKETFDLIFRLLQYCKREWIWHVSGFSWLFIYSVTRIFSPYYTGQVIAIVVATKSYSALATSIYIMIIISLVSAIAAGLRGGSFEYAYSRINRAIRHDLFTGLVRQDVAFFDAHKTGEIASRLAADCQTMSDTVAMNVNVFLRNAVMLVGSMIFMMTLSWRLSLITFILVPIIFVASKIFGSYYDILSERTQNAVADSNDVAEEVLSTMRTVRSFACEEVEGDRFYMKLTKTLNVTKTKAIAYVGFLWVSELFQTFIIVAVMWYGGHLVLSGKMKSDLLVSFLLYQMQLCENLRQMGEVWTGLMQSVGASRKVFEYIDRIPSILHYGTAQPSVLQGRIEFRNVHFSYPTRSNLPILRDLSFTVEPGETVALVGPSGSGKSSCIALLENFYQPNAGQVLVDGVPLEDYEHQYIHRKIALVGQEPVLFARSVTENIRYGVDVMEADVVKAAEMANAHGFIMQTTMKYETNVGEKGSQMSGGQKQRIAIARALVREPAILLLDEATSALDTESEHLVQEAIYKNLDGKSVILIAHRLSTVEKADKIIVINKGKVEQIGTHEELLKLPGTYATLVAKQMMGEQGRSQRLMPSTQSRAVSVSGSHHVAPSLLSSSFTHSASSMTSR
ncbi:ABC tran and ABC membrane domain containing prote in [Trichostrongylus colubriformis]|uniref:ABC-type antigen peptide transporter n=1 Tax=Trichostrongylus colubriformis TaxID=6319 RepID=A0AAN8F1C0_TRICO